MVVERCSLLNEDLLNLHKEGLQSLGISKSFQDLWVYEFIWGSKRESVLVALIAHGVCF